MTSPDGPVDRISSLPETIIFDILSSLATKEAVATSILSRSWRVRWTHVTSFKFDNRGERSKKDFAEFIDKVLLNHSGESINKFALAWESASFRPVYLNRWANIAIAQNVRLLDLKTQPLSSRSQCEFELPSSLYSSGTLEVLRLTGAFGIKPPNLVSLPKLVEMVLGSVIYESDESLHNLISGCPVLYSLSIERTNMCDNLVDCLISSPVLKRLFIFFCNGSFENQGGRIPDLMFKLKLKIEAPALEFLRLFDALSRHFSIEPQLASLKKVAFHSRYLSGNKISGLLQAFRSVEVLAFHSIPMSLISEYLASSESERATLASFERLAKLVFFQPYRARWSTLMDFLDGCIRLEELRIWLVESGGHYWSNPARAPRCLLSSLKCLTLACFDGNMEKMALLKYFLENGLVMERVNISFTGKMHERSFEILNELSQLPRASPACKFSHTNESEFVNCFSQA